jgi:tetratricopeptide (TPR) repeat protein
MWIAVCLGCLSAVAGSGPAQEAAALFSSGNDLYAAGNYEEAARHYRQLVSQGYRSAAVHYNLGNALFKLGQLGPAILEYEKAAKLAPGDADVEANLEFLRTLTADKPSEGRAQTTSFFLDKLSHLTTADQDAVALTTCYLLASGLMGLRILASGSRSRRVAAWGIALLAVPILVTAVSLGVKAYRSANTVHAIVMSERADVRSGLGEDNTSLFTVHEGLKVRLRARQGSWWHVSLDNGLNGWLPSETLGVI